MIRVNGVPSSRISVHTAVGGHFDSCLDVLVRANRGERFSHWLGDKQVREKYFAYLLMSGFEYGKVAVAQPRAGICVAVPLTSTGWSHRVTWQNLRLQFSLPSEKREALRLIDRELEKHADPEGVLLWNLSVRRPFYDQRVALKLIEHVLDHYVEGNRPLYFETVRPSLMRVVQQFGGTEVTTVELPQGGPTLRIGEISVDDLRASLFRKGIFPRRPRRSNHSPAA